MDHVWLSKLSEYCDNLLGEKTDCKFGVTKKTKSSLKSKDTEELERNDTNEKTISSCKKTKKSKKTNKAKENDCEEWNEENFSAVKDLIEGSKNTPSKENLCNDSQENPLQNSSNDHMVTDDGFKVVSSIPEDDSDDHMVTDDGFKVVSSIPEDDSDISDAFESEIDEEEWAPWEESSRQHHTSSVKLRTTEDGFKIISEIPPDDSDVSDAFTDEDDVDDKGDLIAQRKELTSKKSLNKQMAQMITDFGLGEDLLKKNQLATASETKESSDGMPRMVSCVRNSKKRRKKKTKPLPNTVTLAAKRKPPVDVTVYDYTGKRESLKLGTREVSETQDLSLLNSHSLEKQKLEKEMKKMRFDIFKLGMSGFEKEKKEETRVSLAIKLGAKPRKNKFVKYKDLVVTKKEEKMKEKERHEMNKEMGIKEKKKFKPDLKSKKKPRAFTAQIGRYKDGVQYLSKKDLAKIMNS